MRDRWIHVKEIFSAAVATPPHKRRRLLIDNCNGDKALLREVEELLEAYDSAGEFLEEEIASVRDLPMPGIPEDPQPGDDFSGQKLGSYRLERPIGEGGMGTVYLARRDDDLFEKRVAVKIIRRYHDDRRLDRFRKEREILARLTHPNIAQLLDGGVTPDGLPYLVMEHVDGVPIDQHCLERDLDLRSRLHLFGKVFKAVQYAHQSLVVHRDLKPSNILVTREGEPKLLDFGIAKLLEDDGTSATVGTTLTAARWMTPEYASPEQVRGDPITTASDVYSLGVILYRLLTGQSPYEVHSRPIYEVERIICEEEPSRPSTVVTDRPIGGNGESGRKKGTRTVRLRRGLKGDLDNIILMALRKEAHRRYPSVEQFGEDVDRYLNGLPVKAQRDTIGYRSRKFIQRHQFGVAMVLLFVLFAAGAFAFIVEQSNEARRQRDTANELLEYAVSLFESADPEFSESRTMSAEDLVNAGMEKARQQLGDQPEQYARVLELLGKLYQKLGIYSAAEQAHKEALELVAEQGGLRLADGYLALARSMHSQGRFDQAEGLLLDALDLRLEEVGPEAPDLAEVLHELAVVAVEKEQLERADSLIDRAIQIQSSKFGYASAEVARSLRVKATALLNKGQYDYAAELYKETLAIQEETIGLDHLQVSLTLNSLGVVYDELGDYDQAQDLIERALAIKRARLGQNHPSNAATLFNLSVVMQHKEEYQTALVYLEEALSIEVEHFGYTNVEVGKTKHNLAVLLKNMDRFEEAQRNYAEAIEILEASLRPGHPRIAIAKHDYAILLRTLGEYEGSLRLYAEASEIYRLELPQYADELARALNGLGKMNRELGRFQEAIDAFSECLEIRKEILPLGHWRLGTAESFLGEALADVGNTRLARFHLTKGLDILQTALGSDNIKTIEARGRLDQFELSLISG